MGDSTGALPSAIGSFDEIRRQMAGKCIAVFLDYDGTLTPIVAHPDLAILSDDMRAVVRDLAGRCTVAVVSGRDLQDVRGHVEIDALYYAGSHGFDLAGPDGLSIEHEIGREFLGELDAAEKQLTRQLASIQGAWAERKRYAIAVHYRQVADADVPTIEHEVDAIVDARGSLRKTGGKKVFEVRPRVDWHKGKAVRWLLETLNLGGSGTLPIYIGDDVTDEDAFEALRMDGLGVVVMEEPRPTAARYSLRDTDEVGRFLGMLDSELA
ncbi:MAG: trehalose-phosphatase [Dehalococcoidia bacterium]